MSVEDKNVIDVVSTEENNVFLTISDHLEWDEENEHLLTLQDKINVYLNAIESGNLYEEYPLAKNKNIIIRLVLKYKPNEEGYNFLIQVKEILEESGYGFEFKQLDV